VPLVPVAEPRPQLDNGCLGAGPGVGHAPLGNREISSSCGVEADPILFLRRTTQCHKRRNPLEIGGVETDPVVAVVGERIEQHRPRLSFQMDGYLEQRVAILVSMLTCLTVNTTGGANALSPAHAQHVTPKTSKANITEVLIIPSPERYDHRAGDDNQCG